MILFEGSYTGVDVRVLSGGKKFRLLEQIALPDGNVIEPGFECDLDTVPRFLGPVYAWFKSRTVLGAIVHDYYYKNRKGKQAGDEIFLRVMEWEGTRKRYRLPIYQAVKLFGHQHYPD